ncbi:hypothetical protein M3629_17850 [Paenibacillus polysaccharolyticus]|uniref:hypothetical protein n=1 Tax=Paenibacillus polysaccharolyticus TaxID=582692 RepID=UPI0012B8D4AA|nr:MULTISPECIES: hypothetical protein [Paenibacillus]MCM3134657.1 hypothetical protein [Paenibacillus polysaccharolyticus]
MKRALFITFLILFILSGCNDLEKIDINSPSYMFSENSGIASEVKVNLNGIFNKNENAFEGSLSINDMAFEKVIFMHKSLLISYEDAKRTVLGDIYLDKQANQFAIIITEPELYTKLTNEKYQNEGLVISAPASNLEEAKTIEEKLKALE